MHTFLRPRSRSQIKTKRERTGWDPKVSGRSAPNLAGHSDHSWTRRGRRQLGNGQKRRDRDTFKCCFRHRANRQKITATFWDLHFSMKTVWYSQKTLQTGPQDDQVTV